MKNYIIDEEFLGRWADNSLTKEELNFFKQSSEFELYKKIFEKAELFKPVTFDSKKGFVELKQKLQQQKNKPKVVSIFNKTNYFISGIAAAAVLLFGIFFFNFSNEITTTTGIAEKTEITLPDGSIVKLNANSSLSYNNKSFTKKRNLNLKGEAYFKVAKGSKFTVTTSSGTVKVLGTQFNIITRQNLFETVCFEGRVQVNTTSTEKILNPTDGIRFLDNNAENLKISTKKPTWISNISSYKKVKLAIIINEIQNQYKVIIDSEKINDNQIVTTYFTHQNLKEALETVFLPLKIKYTFVDDSNIILE